MRLENLKVFVEVADRKSINMASKELFISAQNISKILSSMEDEIGAKLLERTRHGCYLTPKGKGFYAFCKTTLTQWDNFNRTEIPREEATISGNVRILCSPFLSSFLGHCIQSFQHRHPNVKFDLIVQPGDRQSGALMEQGEFDIVCPTQEESFFFTRTRENESKLERDIYILKKESLRLYFKRGDDMFSNISVVSNKMLSQCPMVLYHPFDTMTTNIYDELIRRGAAPDFKVACNIINICYDFIIKSGLTFLGTPLQFNSTFDAQHMPKIDSLPLQEKVSIYHTAFVKADELNTAARQFFDYLLSQFEAEQVKSSKTKAVRRH